MASVPLPATRPAVRQAAPAAWAAWPALVALALAGCANQPPPVLPTQDVPAAWQRPVDATAGLPAPDLQGWWQAFGDARLDALVAQALRDNLAVAQAASRLRQARILAGRDRNAFKPTLNGAVQTLQDVQAVDSYFHAGLDATWELGLFGTRESVERGGQARLDGAAAAVQGARVATVAEVVRRWLELAAARQDEVLLQRLEAIDERLRALHEVRRRQHLGAMDERRALDLRRTQGLAARTQARVAAVQAEQALAVLLGRTAPDPAWRQGEPAVPTLPPALRLQQVPTDLLRFRPDIRTAEAEVGRASSELGLARAELYPRVTLGLSLLFAYNITQNRRNVNDNVPSFGPAIDIPLFDWGRRRAGADAREEALQAALLAYRQAVVEGVGDVETALALCGLAREREQQLDGVAQGARRGLDLQATRLRLGLASDVERLEAERAGVQAALDLGAARAARGQAFVMLYKALGGAPLADAEAAPPVGAVPAGDAVAQAAARVDEVAR